MSGMDTKNDSQALSKPTNKDRKWFAFNPSTDRHRVQMTIAHASFNYSVPETISTYPNASVDAATNVQLVKNNELDKELDGIESSFGMCWGESRKWLNHPMNHINLQPDLVELLRRKDVLISPSPAVMAQMEDFVRYNARYPQSEMHFLKRFPLGTYEYTIVPTTHTNPIFAQCEDTLRSVAHPAPYYETLAFTSDAHPCFVLSFTMLGIMKSMRRTPLINSDLFPILGCVIYISWHQPLHFYRRPYLGWRPRNLPPHYLYPEPPMRRDRLMFADTDNSSSTSSEDARPLSKRQRLLLSQSSGQGGWMNSVDRWRYGIVPSNVASVAGDEALVAYKSEQSRRLPDVMSNDPLFRRTLTSSRKFALSSKRKCGCVAG